MTSVLGISAFYHDSAAALVVDGEIVAAAQEERFSREKFDRRFPKAAVEYCLSEAGLDTAQLDFVGFYEKPLCKFDRLLETYCAYAPRGWRSFARTIPTWLKQKLHVVRELDRGLDGKFRRRYVFAEHHQSHAASAFYPSPFEEAAILTVDGVGEWATAACGYGRGNKIELTEELHFPHSLGLLYSAFTSYCGFRVDSDEYKLMGLAPFGEPKYVDLIRDRLLDLRPDGSFRMDLSYFNYCHGLAMTSRKFHRLFGGPPRRPGAPIEQRHEDIAASIQAVTEQIVLGMARHVHEQTGLAQLCLAGGVALNCVANGRILREGPFENLWIQPAAGDAGGALGVALFIWHQLLEQPRSRRTTDRQRGSLLGPSFEEAEIRDFLTRGGVAFREFPDDQTLCERVVKLLVDGKTVGWFQGRMEFGPRALGNRSILGDARSPRMKSMLNEKVKFRESFRPFAPSVLAEHAHEFFDVQRGQQSPYMLFAVPVCTTGRRGSRQHEEHDGSETVDVCPSDLPAVTHVDGSARVQTVHDQRHGRFVTLLREFLERTGCPVLLNTSFNVRDEPIVCTPQDAYRCFAATRLDALVMERFLVVKDGQPRGRSHADDAGQAGRDTHPLQTAVRRPSPPAGLVAINRHPSQRQLQWFGLLGAAFVILAGVLARLALPPSPAFYGLTVTALLLVVLLFLVPQLQRPVYLTWMYASYPVAWFVSLLVLTVVYYLVIAPIGVTMRLFGRDSMRRRFTPEMTSYWVPHESTRDKSGHVQQF